MVRDVKKLTVVFFASARQFQHGVLISADDHATSNVFGFSCLWTKSAFGGLTHQADRCRLGLDFALYF
tara:strand:- start:51 stop:254 length:204 start_codon:yes stop_codon:yes gene_type:complete